MTGLDGLPFGMALQVLAAFGPFGIVLLIWWIDARHIRAVVESHRHETMQVLSRHMEWMNETRRMYEANVELVRQCQRLADQLKDIVVMNTEAVVRLSDDIRQNQFCPQLRVEKTPEIHGRVAQGRNKP